MFNVHSLAAEEKIGKPPPCSANIIDPFQLFSHGMSPCFPMDSPCSEKWKKQRSGSAWFSSRSYASLSARRIVTVGFDPVRDVHSRSWFPCSKVIVMRGEGTVKITKCHQLIFGILVKFQLWLFLSPRYTFSTARRVISTLIIAGRCSWWFTSLFHVGLLVCQRHRQVSFYGHSIIVSTSQGFIVKCQYSRRCPSSLSQR